MADFYPHKFQVIPLPSLLFLGSHIPGQVSYPSFKFSYDSAVSPLHLSYLLLTTGFLVNLLHQLKNDLLKGSSLVVFLKKPALRERAEYRSLLGSILRIHIYKEAGKQDWAKGGTDL